ncbi:Mitochondrial dicarboxylate/tricarboxylate transporter DTC [Hibiscus syriacus]|uniref:Mitochondrial dicarboxylate/tricarboxylate transporter DTC n=1 Tax=Hibiscus syriacus TaxID=106335 RepID=A0A6A2WJ92_HIBSY|nr:Mitochondrial dicarboxylate/tricarboxylate transporter DTC [Hibiscus syriacus]
MSIKKTGRTGEGMMLGKNPILRLEFPDVFDYGCQGRKNPKPSFYCFIQLKASFYEKNEGKPLISPLPISLLSSFLLSPSLFQYSKEMADEKKAQSSGVWPKVKPFVNGGASGSTGTVTRNMLKEKGVRAFYMWLSAGLLRQATYTTARLGSFKILKNKATEANDRKPLPLY